LVRDGGNSRIKISGKLATEITDAFAASNFSANADSEISNETAIPMSVSVASTNVGKLA